jgi:hypothetical protein
MAVGQKLGKIMSGIGGGLMMVPGPWSAVGAALLAGGQVATHVGAATDRREAENAAQEQANQPQQMQTEAQDQSRAQQGLDLSTPLPQSQPQPQPQSSNRGVFQPQGMGLGGYQSQLDAGIANLILGNGSGGV